VDTRNLFSKAYLAWYVVVSVIVVVALAWAMQDEAWWKIVIVLAAYVSLVRGAACWFCKRAREVNRRRVSS